MTEETAIVEETPEVKHEITAPKKPIKRKRDIIHFSGEIPTAINLEHVTVMSLEGKRINFEFYTKAQLVDFADEAAALSVFQVLINTWSGDVLE
jgi:hypothetical protein